MAGKTAISAASARFVFCSKLIYIFIQLAIAQDQNLPLPKYGTKTAYDLSFTNDHDIFSRTLSWKELLQQTRSHSKTSTPDLQSCQPVGLYAVYRHGTRYPSVGDVIEFNALMDKIKTSDILNPEFNNLQTDDSMMMDVQQSNILSEAGKVELSELAQRLKNRFPELFPKYLHLNDYSFQSTNLSRTIDSTTAFISGLVGPDRTCSTHQSLNTVSVSCADEEEISKQTIEVAVQKKKADYLLRFYDPYEECLQEQDEEQNGKRREKEVFEMGDEVDQMHHRLAERLTAPGSNLLFNITRDEALKLLKLCAYQRAVFNQSTWCSLLTSDDLRVFEYESDLKHYWKSGYGHRVNYLVGCNLMRDMINYMEQLTYKTNKTPRAVFKFAHAETILPIECILGLNKDDHHLLASDFQKNINRKFRSSQMAPMAANVAFVLFKCSSEGKHPETESRSSKPSYKMTVLVNELPVELPFCQNSSVCDLKDVKTYVEHTMGKCNFNKTCCIENCKKGMHNVLGLVGICLLVFACVVFVIITMKYSIPMAREKYRRYRGNQGHVMLVNEATQL